MTLLSQQLQQLSLPRDNVRSGAIQHASLIFSTKLASDYDIQDIYDIGVNGIEELIALNPCFSRFKDTLFHPTSVKFERLVKTAEFLADMDKEIELFLAYASNYSMLSPAHKAMEWLIRAYKVHLYNADSLLASFIPLHDSKVFAKLLEITTLPADWKWLETAKSNNVHVSREDIVKLCVSNPHYLVYFIKSALKIVEMTDHTSRIHHSFLVTLVFFVLERFDEVPQDIVPKLYGCIVTAISSENKDLKSAGYIITGQIVRKLTLKDDIVRDLINVISAHANKSLAKELVLLLSCILHYLPIDGLPAACIELILQDEFTMALKVIYGKTDISSFIKELLKTIVGMSFSSGCLPQDKLSSLLELPDLPKEISTLICEKYFQCYFAADDSVRQSATVKTLGDILSSQCPTDIQDTFEKYHSDGCDMDVLEGMKSLILGRYIGSDTASKVMEIHHALPGIRMLGLLRITEKLESGSALSEDEKSDVVNSIIARITDEDHSVSLKALDLIQQFISEENVYAATLKAVLDKVEVLVLAKPINPSDAVDLLTSLLQFPSTDHLQTTLISMLINIVPVLDHYHKKNVSVQLRSNKDLRKLSKSVVGESWHTDIVKYLTSYPHRADLITTLTALSTPECFTVLCLVVLDGGLGEDERRTVCSYFLGILNTALERKAEYKAFSPTNLEDVVLTKAGKFFSNFAIMKREWEMVGLVTSVLMEMIPYIRGTEDIRALTSYLMRYSDQYQVTAHLLFAVDKGLFYSSAMEVVLSDDPGSALSKLGIPDLLDNLLECLRLIKITDTDQLDFVLAYLLCALVSPCHKVSSWAYKRLKTISKLEATSQAGLVLAGLELRKGITLADLQQSLGKAVNDTTSVWLASTLMRGKTEPSLSGIYQLLYSVQHPVKLEHALSELQGECGPTNSWVIGELTVQTARILSDNPKLLQTFLSTLRTSHSPVVLVSALNTGLLGALPSSRDVVEVMVKLCAECKEEHTQMEIRQKLTELSDDLTVPVLLSLLKKSVNPHILHVLNMKGISTPELATTLFSLLETEHHQDLEEDIVTLLTSVCTKLGASTPLTPAAVKSVVTVIRETNKQTHRHTLHHNCLVLLAKLAAHFPALVLDHVMDVFTFMGDKTMRMDDSYSIQVLMQTISTIIPVISRRKEMLSIVRVFCDTLPHTPSHRQGPIFKLLLETCGAQYLYYVFLYVLETVSREREEATRLSYFLQHLATHFNLTELLTTAILMIKTLSTLPDKLGKLLGKAHKVRLDCGVELQFSDMKHYNYFKLGLATQLYLITSNTHFAGVLRALDSSSKDSSAKASSPENERMLAELIETSLSIMIHYEVIEDDKFREMLSKRLTGLISSVTAGLPSSLFISVVKALLSTNTPLVHVKSLNILLNKFKEGDSTWTPDFEESIVSLIETLLKLTATQVLTWSVLEHLTKRIEGRYPTETLSILACCISHPAPCDELRACMCVCIQVLGVRCVPHLQDTVTMVTRDIHANSDVLCMVITTVPHFLSKHVVEILLILSLEYDEGLRNVAELLGSRVNIRVLIPTLLESIDQIRAVKPHCLEGVTDTLSHCIQTNTSPNVKLHVTTLASIFTKLLCYRDLATTVQLPVEDHIISCFLHLVYKLTEKEFLPLLVQMLEWSRDSVERSTTFYNLAAQLSEKLQGLFLLFGGYIFNDIVENLDKCTTTPDEQVKFESKKVKTVSRVDLLGYVLVTLYNMLKYDVSHTFTTPDRFDTLLPVLLSLVPLPDVQRLSPALSQLPVAANVDRLWKQFNFQLLNISKSDDNKVRQHVLVIYKDFITKLGQDYSLLLPDSLPFLSELLEDPDSTVEEMAHDVIKTIEATTGESMDQYL